MTPPLCRGDLKGILTLPQLGERDPYLIYKVYKIIYEILDKSILKMSSDNSSFETGVGILLFILAYEGIVRGGVG